MGGTGIHVNVYPGTPPLTFSTMVPSHTSAQEASVIVGTATMPLGVLMMNCTVVSQPRLSVSVTFQTPGHSPPAFGVFCPVPGVGLHTMPMDPDPPEKETVAVP